MLIDLIGREPVEVSVGSFGARRRRGRESRRRRGARAEPEWRRRSSRLHRGLQPMHQRREDRRHDYPERGDLIGREPAEMDHVPSTVPERRVLPARRPHRDFGLSRREHPGVPRIDLVMRLPHAAP